MGSGGIKQLSTPLTEEKARELRAGDKVEITGIIYTARDAAHKRMIEALERGEGLPIEIKDAIIYYAGPAPTPPNKAIGSVGPTTGGRMDAFAPRLIQLGLAENGPERCLCQLRGGVEVVFDFRDRLVGHHHAEIHDRIHLYRYVIARDHVLGRDVHCYYPEAHLDHPID